MPSDGIEPTPLACKASVLPLYEPGLAGALGVEPSPTGSKPVVPPLHHTPSNFGAITGNRTLLSALPRQCNDRYTMMA